VQRFYDRLRSVLGCAAVRDGQWQLLECVPAWDGNWTSDCYLAWMWTGPAGEQRLVAVNYAGNQSQCYVRLPASGEGVVSFRDLMGDVTFDRESHDLAAQGLYLDLAPWGYHVFDVAG
jgi:hypothetical protein